MVRCASRRVRVTMPRKKKRKKTAKAGEQLALARTGGRGGHRRGAGRKPLKGKRRGVPHRARARLDGKKHPVHVTVRAKGGVGVPPLRCEIVRRLLKDVLRETASSEFHVPHFSIQRDHLHLL